MKATMVCGSKAVVDLTGVPGGQVDYGATTGVVRPAIQSAAGEPAWPRGQIPCGTPAASGKQPGQTDARLKNWVNGWHVAIGS